jgi:hypothetical protein
MSQLTTSSIADKIAAAFPFSVDKLPLVGPEGLRTPHYGLFRGDSGDCIGIACKQGYVPHTTDDIVALAQAASGAFSGECDVRCHFNDGHFVTIIPPVEHRRAIFGTQDNIFPRMIIRAGYDGRAFRGELGFFRDCCRNMAIVRPVGARVSDVIRHTHHLPERLEELQRIFTRLAAGWDGIAATALRLEATEIDLADFLRQVYPLTEDATRRTRNGHDRRVERIIRRVARERLATGRPELKTFGRTFMVSAWEALNGVQGYVQHDMPRHGRPGDMQRAILALEDAAVGRATELALSLAV